MSNAKPWVKALKINSTDYETWSSEVSSEESVTFWALDKGKIKAQDYLLWAREHYQLPVLKDSWFKKHCNHQLWSQIQSVANWSPHMMPIEEWDGVVYVAVVEPPEDVQWSFPVAYVLAHARSLKSHWKTLQDGPSESESEATPEPAPEIAAGIPEDLSGPEPVAEEVHVQEVPDIPDPSTPLPEVVAGEQQEVTVYPSDNALPPIPEDLPNIPDSLDVPNFEMTDTNVSTDSESDDNPVDHLASIDIPSADALPESGEFVQQQEGEGATASEIHVNIPEANEVMSDGETQDPGELSDSSMKIPTDFELNLPETPASTDALAAEMPAPEPVAATGDSPEGISLDIPQGAVDDVSPEGISLDIPMASGDDSSPEGISLNLPDVDTAPEGMGASAPEGMEATLAPEETLTVNTQINLETPVETPPAAPKEPAQEVAEAPPQVAADDSTLGDLGVKKPPEFKLNFDVGEGGVDDSPPVPTQVTNTTHTNEGTVTRFNLTVTGVNKEAPQGAVIDIDKTAPHTSDACSNESEAAAWLFSELKSHYQQSMILILNGDELKPWKWENSWTPKSKAAFNPFNPDQPGLFRIIKRTKQPYHGYVVDSPLNKEFFKLWGFDNFPEHVTALPMIVEGHLTGIVLCLGDESSASDRALMDAEKIVTEFVSTIVRVTSLAA